MKKFLKQTKKGNSTLFSSNLKPSKTFKSQRFWRLLVSKMRDRLRTGSPPNVGIPPRDEGMFTLTISQVF